MKRMKKLILLALVVSNFSYAFERNCYSGYTSSNSKRFQACFNANLDAAEKEMNNHLAKGIEYYETNPLTDDSGNIISADIIESINESQAQWLKYRESHCKSISLGWLGKEDDPIKVLSCKV